MKYKTMTGHYTRYIPGWIRTVCQSSMRLLKTRVLTVMNGALDLRNKCKEYALECVENQKQDFIRFGVLGEWERPYLTLRPEVRSKTTWYLWRNGKTWSYL